MSNQSNDITVSGIGDTVVNGKKGSWIKVSGADCGNSAKSITIKASSANGGAIKVCTGSPTGKAVSYIEVPSGNSMQEITAQVTGLTGTNDIYFLIMSK